MDDLKVSLRQLAKSPVFTLAAIVVLALGIGLNAAMFSAVHALTIAARPFPEPERLVQLYSRDARTNDYRPFSYQVYEELSRTDGPFTGILGHGLAIVGIGDGVESRRAFASMVSANYFDVLGVRPVQGRGFTEEEARAGRDIPVVVVSHTYWRRAGLDPDLVGKTVRINERHYTIVGITPPGFTGTMSVFGPELFFPLGVFDTLSNDLPGLSTRTLSRPDAYQLFLVGRVKDDVPMASASQAVELAGHGLARSFPAENEHQALSIAPLPKFGTSTSPSDESVLGTLGLMLLGMTGAVLLTVCLNLASMLLARGRARRKEFAVRLALGGGRMRLIRQLLVEGALLSAAGGAIGVLLGNSAIDALTRSVATIAPITIAIDTAVSPALVGATVLFCLFATLAFALGPALKHTRADILSDLKAQPGDDPAPRGWRFVPRNPLVAAQVALSLCLLIAAGLFLRMALGAASTDLGYEADHTVLAEVDGQMGGFDQAQSLNLYQAIEERLASLPGVSAASVGAITPMGAINISREVQRAGVRPPPGSQPATPESGKAFDAPWNAVGTAYFDAMGIRLLEGRRFTASEVYGRGSLRVAVIDEALARKLWPEGGALGQRIQWAEVDETRPGFGDPMEVVGIVSSTRQQLFDREPGGAVYVPLAQDFASNVFFHVRPERPGTELIDVVRREVRAAAPAVPIFGVRTFAAHVAASPEYWFLRLSTSGFTFFGVMALVVALVGIYGVTAYAVARRTREIGVRMAVGARPIAVLRLVLGESLGTVASGIVAGWLLGIGIGRLMASVFVDLPAFDLLIFVLVPLGFIAASLGATLVPARRATAINPVTALRAE